MKRKLIFIAVMTLFCGFILFVPDTGYAQTEPTDMPPPDCYHDVLCFWPEITITPDYHEVIPQKTPVPVIVIACCTRDSRITVERVYYNVESRWPESEEYE